MLITVALLPFKGKRLNDLMLIAVALLPFKLKEKNNLMSLYGVPAGVLTETIPILI